MKTKFVIVKVPHYVLPEDCRYEWGGVISKVTTAKEAIRRPNCWDCEVYVVKKEKED